MKRTALPVTEEEMKALEDMMIQQVNENIQSVTLNLPIRSKETCWYSLLTQDQKEEEVFVGKCGECQVVHEYPRCQQCRKPRQKSGPCSGCNYTKQQEDPYKGYCGNCFQMHEFPNCVQCQHYRIKPGRCTNCGVVGPDNTEWVYTCLGQDEEYERLMTPVLEARKKKIAEETKNFTTYKNCPLCRGFFHSAKACIFRTHFKCFNILKARMDLFADENTTTKMVIPESDSEESDDSEDEEDGDCDSEVDESYMLVTRPAQNSDEEDMDEDPDSFSAKFKEMIKYDKILTIATRQKYQEKKKPKPKQEEEEEEEEEEKDEQDDYMEVQNEDDQNEDDDDSHGEGQRNSGNQEGQEEDQDQDQAGQAENQDENQTDEDLEEGEQPEERDIVMVLLVKKTEENQEKQKQDNQPNKQNRTEEL